MIENEINKTCQRRPRLRSVSFVQLTNEEERSEAWATGVFEQIVSEHTGQGTITQR